MSLALRIRALLADALLGAYIGAVVYRIVWGQILGGSPPGEVTLAEWLGYAGCAGGFALVGQLARCTPGAWLLWRESMRPWQRAVAQHVVWATVVLTIWTGWSVARVSPVEFFSSKGLESAARLFGALLRPELSILDAALLAMLQTIYIALMATVLGLPPALLLGFLAARNLMRAHPVTFALYAVLRVWINFVRSVEPLIWAVIFSVWVGIGPFAGMLAMLLHTVAALAKLYSEQVESIDPGLVEAVESTGAHPIQVVFYGVVPQVLLPFLAFTIYRWDSNVRMATVIGLVGGGGIGTLLMQYQGLARWQEVGMIVLLIAAVVWVMDYLSARIREMLS